ncbi:unnamed protein product [Urochloa humidicola]
MEEEKVWMASLKLDGMAVKWYYQMESEFGIVSWARFVDFVTMRFGPPIRSNALGELKDLCRTGTVEEYERHFLALLCRCEGLTPCHQVDLFTSGLGQPLAFDVEMQQPSDLQTVLSLACAFELCSKEAEHAVSVLLKPKSWPATTPSSSVAAPSKPEDKNRPRFRCLSAEEMAEKCASGLCYFCLEKFSREHKCTGRDGLFCLSMDESEDDGPDITEDDVCISLHALNGVTTGDTIKLIVQIKGLQLTALVDSSSTLLALLSVNF